MLIFFFFIYFVFLTTYLLFFIKIQIFNDSLFFDVFVVVFNIFYIIRYIY